MKRLWWSLVRLGFRLLYNEMAWTYDLVSQIVSLGQWRCWQRTVFNHLGASSANPILELAHGTGNLQLDFHARGCRAIGYDLSPHMGRITRRKLLRHNIPPSLVQGRAQILPFPSGAFSAVVSTFPTDFIVAPETLTEIHRVLKADGQLIVVPGAVLTGAGIVSRFLEWLYRVTGQRDATPADAPGLFEPYGFQIEIVRHPCPYSTAYVIVARRQ